MWRGKGLLGQGRLRLPSPLISMIDPDVECPVLSIKTRPQGSTCHSFCPHASSPCPVSTTMPISGCDAPPRR
ncbi:hypothetical protein SKAU_G00053580 [Synaphobranchus kaupii]|uniref:Uncharacterized protein n=1 Tax=Synaphobranchus kaupii TaxID=118154 RepID=A0A9Q1J9P1_SYNKA|nr:hypothetical protein SKAU_G00053580 [Synaphobranchus kaupii]